MKIRTLSDAEIKRELGIEFVVARNLSQFGGLQPFLKFLDKVRIRERLTACCGTDKASALLQLMFGLVVGTNSMEGVAEVCKDPAFKSFIKRPLSATQLTRTFKKITAAEISSLHELTTALGIMEFAETSYRGLTVTLDIDATAVEKYGKQEGVAAGYIAKDEIKPCYQYFSRAYEIYNGRANIENNIREMKNDYGLGKIVTESFQVNDAITQATLILYILVGHFKRHCLDKDDQKMQLSTVRRKFFHLPARFMSSSRYEWSRICSAVLDKLKWSRIISRVLALRSILTIPLPLQTG
jgi:hypothetical protein